MVTIEKNGNTLLVTMGAYKNFYKSMGYTLLEAEEVRKVLPASKEVNVTNDYEEDPMSNTESYEDETSDDMEEKPLSEMSFNELKEYADRLGINTNGVSSKKELRIAIRKMEE